MSTTTPDRAGWWWGRDKGSGEHADWEPREVVESGRGVLLVEGEIDGGPWYETLDLYEWGEHIPRRGESDSDATPAELVRSTFEKIEARALADVSERAAAFDAVYERTLGTLGHSPGCAAATSSRLAGVLQSIAALQEAAREHQQLRANLGVGFGPCECPFGAVVDGKIEAGERARGYHVWHYIASHLARHLCAVLGVDVVKKAHGCGEGHERNRWLDAMGTEEQTRVYRDTPWCMPPSAPVEQSGPRDETVEEMRREAERLRESARGHTESGHDIWAAEDGSAAAALQKWADKLAGCAPRAPESGPRDETVPPPGWVVETPGDSIIMPVFRRLEIKATPHAAWGTYDSEYSGYAPRASPVEQSGPRESMSPWWEPLWSEAIKRHAAEQRSEVAIFAELCEQHTRASGQAADPSREEMLRSLETAADRCVMHHGALGEHCSSCGEIIDGMSKDARRKQREWAVDSVLEMRAKRTAAGPSPGSPEQAADPREEPVRPFAGMPTTREDEDELLRAFERTIAAAPPTLPTGPSLGSSPDGEPACPGPDCPMCNGEACALCGAGCSSGRPAQRCEHDVDQRHREPPAAPQAETAGPLEPEDEPLVKHIVWLVRRRVVPREGVDRSPIGAMRAVLERAIAMLDERPAEAR